MLPPIQDHLVNFAYVGVRLHEKLFSDIQTCFEADEHGRTAADISASQHGLVEYGTHHSLWETVGNPYTLLRAGGRMPRAWMGSNLIKGDAFQHLASQLGIRILPRGQSGPGTIRKVYADTLEAMLAGETMQIYPQLEGGGRSRTGKPRPWSPVVPGAQISASQQAPTYASTVTVDYENGPNELVHLAHGGSGYTFRAKHAPEWFRPQGRIWVTRSAPVEVTPDTDKRELTDYLRRTAHRNKKITAKSAASAALLKAYKGNDNPPGLTRLRRSADEVLDQVFKYSSKLTFDLPADPLDLYDDADVHPGFDLVQAEILAGYIDHYLHPDKYPDIMQENAPFGI